VYDVQVEKVCDRAQAVVVAYGTGPVSPRSDATEEG